ncbi:transglycosylase SLT domain-containing protein [Hydromonas duriensis]|uniref:Transglycosylase-like protein with SLT domain n=1 Tax=Hydromonas duriensis TaxID=1527608 RepID=A0A4R6Y6K5_9BURK|nr:transglycosylase SLT domain-containing protein [Hydromonas duriensis]TDR30671.1 transglycosylase-like protein with SLT domain [Hydromonas duriensis]
MTLKHDKDGFLVGRGGKDILELIHDNTEDILEHVKAMTQTPTVRKLHIGLKLPKPTTPQAATSKPQHSTQHQRHRDATGRFIKRAPNTSTQNKKRNQNQAAALKAQQEQIKWLKRIAKQPPTDQSYKPIANALTAKGLNRAAIDFAQGERIDRRTATTASTSKGVLSRPKKLLGGLARIGGRFMRKLPVLGTLLGLGTAAWQMSQINRADMPDTQKGQQKASLLGRLGGGLAGSSAGAIAGGIAGSIIPGIGTAIGGTLGAIVGGIAGEPIGQALGEWLKQTDWQRAWDKTRQDMSAMVSQSTRAMSQYANDAFEGFKATFPVITNQIQEMAQAVKNASENLLSKVIEGAQSAQQSFNGQNIQGANPDGTLTTAQTIGSTVGQIGRAGVDWLKSKNPFNYDGLKLKAGATNGGTTANGVTAMIHAVNDRLGQDIVHHASLNDKYHHQNIGYHSLHKDGLGFDTTFESANQMQAKGLTNGQNTAAKQRYTQIKQYVESMGFTVGGKGTDVELIDEYNKSSKKATGGHIHFAFRNQEAAKRYEDMVRHGQSTVRPATQAPMVGPTPANTQIIRPKGAKGFLTIDQLNQTFALDDKLGLLKGTVAGQMYQESKLDPKAVSRSGARGWAQIMPAVQAGHEQNAKRAFNPANFEDALKMQEMSLNTFRYKNGRRSQGKVSDEAMFRGYNGGWKGQAGQLNGVENRQYYAKVMAGRQEVLAAMNASHALPKAQTRLQPTRYPIAKISSSLHTPLLQPVAAIKIQTPVVATQAIAIPTVKATPASSQHRTLVSQDASAAQAPYLVHKSLSQRVSHDKIAWVASGGIGMG